MWQNKQARKGSALVSAIFITAIAATIATALAVQQHLLIHESELVTRADQAYLNLQSMQYASEMAVETYAVALANPKKPDNALVPLQTKLPNIKINNSVLSGIIDDEQGKFNINDLVYSANQPRFVTLLQAVIPQISLQQAYVIAKSITEWMTSNSLDAYYLKLNPAYRASETQMANISELALVNGITPDIFSAIEPYVTALPVVVPTQEAPAPQTPGAPISAPSTLININSASAPVLLTTNPALNLSKAENIAACRKHYGEFADTAAFIADCVKSEGIDTLNGITTSSTYFLSRSQAKYADHVDTLNSLLVTQIQKNNTLKVVIVWQSFE